MTSKLVSQIRVVFLHGARRIWRESNFGPGGAYNAEGCGRVSHGGRDTAPSRGAAAFEAPWFFEGFTADRGNLAAFAAISI